MRRLGICACLALALACSLPQAEAACPYASAAVSASSESGVLPNPHRELLATQAVDYAAVKADLKMLMTDSQPFWPADFGYYGGLFIRLAWHCSGSYRASDGRGGCDGSRIRHNPEHSWPDNTNLDKALRLLQPIKLKYGDALSWGDLIVLSGDVAIEAGGGPILGFCGGRTDDVNGDASVELGPSLEQQLVAPCPVQGDCKAPLGPTTMGLIYVNPEGPMGKPIPKESAPQIRDSFGRMGMNDSETVALIGGGHAFGKAHGACKTGPGPDPTQDPANPYPGTCGTGLNKGKGINTFTSGFEGPWTSRPTKWSNDYFTNLLNYNWEVHVGPGGHNQWRPVKKQTGPPTIPIMMLTTDVSLLQDKSYNALVEQFASNSKSLDTAFAHAWYKLTSRDMGPVTRCLGNLVPPAQPWQNPLPPPPATLADWSKVRADIVQLISSPTAPGDAVGGKPYAGAMLATLAYRCAITFRATDYLGGCNGARIRFKPQSTWKANSGLDKVLASLNAIKTKYGAGLSWADLIVLAGTTAVEEASGLKLEFCGGRTDASEGSASDGWLAPRTFKDPMLEVRDNAKVSGFTSHEVVALAGRLRSPAQMKLQGYSGTWTATPNKLSNAFYTALITETWVASPSKKEYKAAGKASYMLPTDMALKWDTQYLAIAQEYASSNEAFLDAFGAAWTKLMNADRYDGPGKNLCESTTR